MAHFEQDQHYQDMDGNLKTFTVRDYSKPKGIAMSTSTEETKTEAQRAYDESIWDMVDTFIEENPAVFAREYDNAVEIVSDRVEWNRSALFFIAREFSDWKRLQLMITKSILDYLGYTEPPHNFLDVIESFRLKYKTEQTI